MLLLVQLLTGNSSLFALLQENVTVRIARIFNTFGPRMHMNDGRVVSNFILQSLQDMPITVCARLCAFALDVAITLEGF